MEKIKQLIEKVKCTFCSICDTIKNVKSNVDFYKDLWDRPQGKAAVSKVFEQLLYLLKKIRPKQIEGDVEFGTGDPADTGRVIGAVASVYGFIPEKLHIQPNFEEEKLEGNLYIKGKFRVIHLVVSAVKMIADKNVRFVIRKIIAREGKKDE